MPGWEELKKFCDRDGWELYKDTDHYFYRKIDDDGNIKLTKVSKGSGEILLFFIKKGHKLYHKPMSLVRFTFHYFLIIL